MITGATIMPTMNIGIRIVEMMKLLRLTRERYSREMIILRLRLIVREVLRVMNYCR